MEGIEGAGPGIVVEKNAIEQYNAADTHVGSG